jgi:TonB family protein
VTVPSVVHEVRPIYTAEAMRRKVNGTVLLNAVVLPTGRVGDVVVAVSLDKEYGLDDEAVRALKDWRFEPGTREGRPAPVIVSVAMSLSLR